MVQERGEVGAGAPLASIAAPLNLGCLTISTCGAFSRSCWYCTGTSIRAPKMQHLNRYSRILRLSGGTLRLVHAALSGVGLSERSSTTTAPLLWLPAGLLLYCGPCYAVQ